MSRTPSVERAVLVAVVACGGLAACSTVEPGGNFQLAQVHYDEDFFVCAVEPQVLLPYRCGPGDPNAGDPSSGCHSTTTSFRLVDHAPVPCNGIVPSGSIPPEADQNYQASITEMSLDVDSAPLLTHPIGKATHPRTIFADAADANGVNPADVIRDWATKHASR